LVLQVLASKTSFSRLIELVLQVLASRTSFSRLIELVLQVLASRTSFSWFIELVSERGSRDGPKAGLEESDCDFWRFDFDAKFWTLRRKTIQSLSRPVHSSWIEQVSF